MIKSMISVRAALVIGLAETMTIMSLLKAKNVSQSSFQPLHRTIRLKQLLLIVTSGPCFQYESYFAKHEIRLILAVLKPSHFFGQ
jgi:hypothetical protein